MPKTVDAVILPGWKTRDEAVTYLQNDCVFDPQLTDQQAEDFWRPYRDRVEALGQRKAAAPQRVGLSGKEQQWADNFLQTFRARGAKNIRDVMKIDPMALVVHQHYVLTDRADRYSKTIKNKDSWMHECLNSNPPPPRNIQIYPGAGSINVMVPHMEFMFGFDQRTGFAVQELLRLVTVTEFQNRLLLWSGYHRSYARTMSMVPDAIDRSILVVLTTDGAFMVGQASPNQGLRDTLCGLCPPLFKDFFDPDFFMRVKLREKRFELQIRAQVVAIDA